MKKSFGKPNLKLAALALVAAAGVACCGGNKSCNTACGEGCTTACGDSCACTAACATAPVAGIVYNANEPIKLDSMKLFLEDAKTEPTVVKENVTRKLINMNDLMTVIVDFDNGPMAQPDPPHSHAAEQISYVAIGECDVYIGDQPAQHLKTGDMFAIPANVPHTVKSTTKKLRLVDSFNPIREDFLKK